VQNWWTGGFTVHGADPAASPDASKPSEHSGFSHIHDVMVRARAASKSSGARGFSNARDVMAATIRVARRREQESRQRRAAGSPLPPRRTLTPRDARLPAAEQLRRARARAHRARTRAQQRLRHRAQSRPRHINGGVVSALVAGVLGVAIAIIAANDGNMTHLNIQRHGQDIVIAQSDHDGAINLDPSDVTQSISELSAEFKDFLVGLRERVVNPTVEAAGQAIAASASLAHAPENTGFWLVLSDVGPGAPETLHNRIQNALTLLAVRGWTLVGVGDTKRDIDLVASARNAIGIEVSEAPGRLSEWLGKQGKLLSGVVWLRRDDSYEGLTPVVVARAGSDLIPILDALRLAD